MYGLSEESLTIVGVILIVVGVAMIGWGFEWNQDITNDKRVGTVVRDIGVMVLATGIIFVMQRAVNNPRLNRFAGYRPGLPGATRKPG